MVLLSIAPSPRPRGHRAACRRRPAASGLVSSVHLPRKLRNAVSTTGATVSRMNAGRKHTTSGKSIFTGAARAASSTAARRRERISRACDRSVDAIDVPSKQAEAVRFLNENVFTTPTFFFDPEILRRIEPTGFVERMRVRQNAVLSLLFQDGRLSRLAEQGQTQPGAYTIADLFGDVRRGIFSELAGAGNVRVDAYRRNLQRAFVDQMERLISTPLVTPPPPGFTPFPGFQPPPPRPADARAQARLELVDLQGTLRVALARVADRATRAHLVDLQARINQILNPRG